MRRNFSEWLESQTKPWRPLEIPPVLESGDLYNVFQPIVSLQTGRTFAYEALARSTSPHYTGPPVLFREAVQAKCCGALGRLLRELAVQACPNWPLFLNINPNEFDEGWLVQPNDPIFEHEQPLYIEITESVPLSHFFHCHNVLREIRGKGIHLAIDDLGAGYSNLKYIADLSPEIVKLDRSLIGGLPEDPRLRTIVGAIVKLSEELGAKTVAEGLERTEEVRLVRELGAHYGQGFVFARPSFPPSPRRFPLPGVTEQDP